MDYDATYMLTMELDGDDPGSASNDFGIDDPAREYRGVRVAQMPLSVARVFGYSDGSRSPECTNI